MKKNMVNTSLQKDSQQGAVLIVVLFVVVLVVGIGVVAVKRSVSDLSVSTVGQIDKISFRGADAAFAALEDATRDSTGDFATDVTKLGGFILEKAPEDTEVSLCYKYSATNLLSNGNLTHRNVERDGYINSLNSGACNVAASSEDYVSKRKVSMTQLTVVRLGADQLAAGMLPEAFMLEQHLSQFDNSGLGGRGSTSANLVRPKRVCAYAVSLLPSFAKNSTTTAQINSCLQKPVIYKTSVTDANGITTDIVTTDNVNSVKGCLKSLQIPFDFHVQEYDVKIKGIQMLSRTSATTNCIID